MCVARHPSGHPRALDVELHLYADDGAEAEGDEQHDGYGVDAQLHHLAHVAFPEHAQTLGPCKGAAHDEQILAEGGQVFCERHIYNNV